MTTRRNFLKGGTHIDMNQDARVQLLADVLRGGIGLGACAQPCLARFYAGCGRGTLHAAALRRMRHLLLSGARCLSGMLVLRPRLCRCAV